MTKKKFQNLEQDLAVFYNVGPVPDFSTSAEISERIKKAQEIVKKIKGKSKFKLNFTIKK